VKDPAIYDVPTVEERDEMLRQEYPEPLAYLREVDAGTDNACWIVCARGDRGGVPVYRHPNSVIAIYHERGRWRAECALVPELNVSSKTLWSLLHAMRDRVDHVVESAVTTARIMRQEFSRGDMTPVQVAWLEDNPNYEPVGKPRPDVRFVSCGTLYADGRFDPMAPMKVIRIEPGSFGVGIRVHPQT